MFQRLTNFLDSMVKNFTSCCVCLIEKDGKEIYRHLSGYANIEKMIRPDPSTLYRLYSITKMFTATAILQLLEKGAVSLDQYVEWYLPEFAGSGITILHLLTMQSGLPYPGKENGPNAEQVGKFILSFRDAHSNYSTQEYAAMLGNAGTVFSPGKHFLYGTSYDVLAAIIEKLSGLSLGEYFRIYILEPAGMFHTGFKINNRSDWERLAGIYSRNRDGGLYRRWEKDRQYRKDFAFEEGGGGLLVTIDDLMTFARIFHRNGLAETGKRILEEGSIRLMTTNTLDSKEKQRDFAEQFFELSEGKQVCDYGYGMGVRVRIKSGQGKDSPVGEFGWYGMSGNYLLIDRQNRLSVLYMQQMIPGNEKEIHPRLRKLIYEAIL